MLRLAQADGSGRYYCRNSMLIDHLLLSRGLKNDHEAVRAGHSAPELKSVHEEHGHKELVLSYAVEENIL